jgi:hypothetical protein
MPSDTVTLRLNGEVTLSDFSKAMSGFNALIKALTETVGGPIEWVIADLDWSSAITTAQGKAEDPSRVARAVGAYATVGKAAETDTPIPYSKTVQTATGAILSVLNGGPQGVNAIDFETAETESTVRVRPETTAKLVRAIQPRFGAAIGRVQTLTNRGSLRFTLYDLLHDKAISCYLAEGREASMRDVWGKIATVEGVLTRDEATGRVKSIRQVSRVTPQEEGSPDGYLAARGASPSLSGLSAIEAIRRVRDA